jgi:MFS superfamily sulfate permease-like transporter
VAGITASAIFGLQRLGIALVGEVQGGLPMPAMPNLALAPELYHAAMGIALMSFVETAAAGRAFRDPDEPDPQPNAELRAIGLTNIIGAFFQNMPSGGGTSQTAVNRNAGARTQLAGVVTAAVVLAVLLFLAPVVHLMPQAALAVVVVIPCAGMVKVREFHAIWRCRWMEFSWAMASVTAVMVFGTLRGVVAAVILSLLGLIVHGTYRPVFVLARKPGTGVFRPLSPEHPDDELVPGLLLLKTEGMVHFANVQHIADLMRPYAEKYQPKVVVFDCSAIPDFEYSALKVLTQSEQKLRQSGIRLWLAGLNPEPLRLIQNSAIGQTLGREGMYFNLEQAVASFKRQYGSTPSTASPPHTGTTPQTPPS